MYKESIEGKSHYFKYIFKRIFLWKYLIIFLRYNPTGNVFDAVDLVMEGRVKIAFELVPPPSHHSGYFWPIESLLGIWGGSCIVNNISIEVPYAKFKYQNEIKKIKMIDFDVHHGNRTEEIV